MEIIISNSNKSFFYLKALGWIQLIWFPVKFARIKCLKFSTIPMSSLVKDDREMCKYLSAKTYQLKDCYFEGERVCVSNQTFVQIGRRGRFRTKIPAMFWTSMSKRRWENIAGYDYVLWGSNFVGVFSTQALRLWVLSQADTITQCLFSRFFMPNFHFWRIKSKPVNIYQTYPLNGTS